MRHVDFSCSYSPIALYIRLVCIRLYLIFPQSRLFPQVVHDKYHYKIIMSRFTIYSTNCTVVALLVFLLPIYTYS
jgi:hypothetical protein